MGGEPTGGVRVDWQHRVDHQSAALFYHYPPAYGGGGRRTAAYSGTDRSTGDSGLLAIENHRLRPAGGMVDI